MLELLARILETFWDAIPRPLILGPTDKAVVFFAGKWGRVLGPGVYGHWPILEVLETFCVVSRLIETAILPCSDKDGKSWQCRLVVEYEVTDPMAAYMNQEDAQLHAEQLAGSSAVRLINRIPTGRIQTDFVEKGCLAIQKRMNLDMRKRGIEIVSVRCVMLDRCRSLFLSHAERLAE